MDKKINDIVFSCFSMEVEKEYIDLANTLDSVQLDSVEYLVEMVYKEGFKDALMFSSWLNNETIR